MNDIQYGDIPARLDDPPKFIWWDFDVALLFMGCLVFGVATEFFFTSIAIGLLMAYTYQKAKQGKHAAYGMHLIYWVTPVTFGMKATPPSSIREYIG